MNDIRNILEQGLDNAIFSAAACGFYSADHGTKTVYVGATSYEKKSELISREHLFDLASLTKVFATSLLMADLVNSEKIALDTCLGKTILGVELSECLQGMSLQSILSHHSGLPAWIDFSHESITQGFVPGTYEMQRAMVSRINMVTAIDALGAKVVYSDLGFILLRFWLEETLGKTFEALVVDLFDKIDPGLAMMFNPRDKHTLISQCVATELRPLRSSVALQGVVHDDNTYLLGGVSSHAGLFGSLEASMTLGQEWLKAYYGKSKLFSKKTCDSFSARRLAHNGSQWATGWDVPSAKGSTAGDLISHFSVGHLGYTGTSIWIDFEKNALGVLLTNRVHPSDGHKDELRVIRRKIFDGLWSFCS